MKEKDQPGQAALFLWYMLEELFLGIRDLKINPKIYLFPGILIALFFVLRVDYLISFLLQLDLKLTPFSREVIVYLSITLGFLVWSVERATFRWKLLKKLRSTFLDLGLTANKTALPQFIEDKPIDDYVRKLKVFSPGIPLKKFLDNQIGLEAHFNISVVKIEEEVGDKSRVSIIYAMKALPEKVALEDLHDFKDGEVPIGISYEGRLSVNIRDIAHILVAGQTGGGKSNFLKIAASTFVLNNPESETYFLDFKGGMELADLKDTLNAPNFHFFEGPKAAVTYLTQLGSQIETRLQMISKSGSSSLDEYLKKKVIKKRELESSTDPQRDEADIKRLFIIIDEIAQLYSRDFSLNKEEVKKAREAVNRIARQGRAAGVHLVVATQKPDSSSFDQTVKANLPAVLCFPMATQSASVSALGVKRAYDLNPESKGRAIWKFGPILKEVQTYYYS